MEETLWPERAEHLVRGDMVKAEAILGSAVERCPMPPSRLEQLEGAVDVRLDERARAIDRAVHVALGGEMHDDVGLVILEDAAERAGIADVGVFEAVARVVGDTGQIVEVAGVGQLVEVQDLVIGVGDEVAHDSRADEACASRHDEAHR